MIADYIKKAFATFDKEVARIDGRYEAESLSELHVAQKRNAELMAARAKLSQSIGNSIKATRGK